MHIDEFWTLLCEFGSGTLTAQTSLGLRTRPILPTIDRQRNEVVSIIASSWLQHRSGRDIDVSLSFIDEFRNSCLSIAGRMTVSDREDDIAAGWTGLSERWFPDGKSQKEIVALRTTPQVAELWSLTERSARKRWRIEGSTMTEIRIGE